MIMIVQIHSKSLAPAISNHQRNGMIIIMVIIIMVIIIIDYSTSTISRSRIQEQKTNRHPYYTTLPRR